MTDAQVINVDVVKCFEDILRDITQGDEVPSLEKIFASARDIQKLNRDNFLGSNTGVPILYQALATQVGRRIDSLTPDKDQHKKEIDDLNNLKDEYQNSGGL